MPTTLAEEASADALSCTMGLTEAELEMAQMIKRYVQDLTDVDTLTDLEYAQYAIIAILKGDPLYAVAQQIQGIQQFKEEHGIRGTLSEGLIMLSRMVQEIRPGFHLSFFYDEQEQRYVHAFDITSFDTGKVMTSLGETAAWMASEYYLKQACFPTIKSLREGLVCMVECEGYDWRDREMFNLQALRRLAPLGTNLPMNERIKVFHAGTFANLLLSACITFLPPHLWRTMEFASNTDNQIGRLDTILLVPTQETAQQRVLENMQQALRLRYQNEETFRLEEATMLPDDTSTSSLEDDKIIEEDDLIP